MNAYARWFGRFMWLGIVADWVLAVPAWIAPELTMQVFRLRPTGDPIWTAFAGQLLFLVSLFYIAPARDPYRYRFSAWVATLARVAGVLYFLVLNPGFYPAFGYADGVFLVIQLPLLLLTMRHAPAVAWPEPETLLVKRDDRAKVWLKRTLWLGIIADWVLGVPGIFAPEWVLATTGFRPSGDPVWTGFAAVLLTLLGVFYVGGANWPYRCRSSAQLAVFARTAGVLFFFVLWPGYYPAFGILDGTLFVLQLPFLIKTLQAVPERRFWANREHVSAR